MTGETLNVGNYIEWQGARRPLSLLRLAFLPLDMIVQWRRCGQSADYVAGFLSYQFVESGRAMIILSTIVNELLENTVKFSHDKKLAVSFSAAFFGDITLIEARNNVNEAQMKTFCDFIDRLVNEDLDELFISQIEDSADQMTTSAGLGLITLRKDYVTDMGFHIARIPDTNLYEVTVQLHLDPDRLE